MFFEKEIMSFTVLDVIKLEQKNVNSFNSGRNFCALSFRIHSDAVLKTYKSSCSVGDNCVAYVPARLDYTRIAKNDKMIVIHFDTTDYHADEIEFFLPDAPQRIEELFSKIYTCWSGKETGYRYKCSAIFYEILAECYCRNYRSDISSSKIKNSVEYILKNYKDRQLTVGDCAERSFMSEVYFRKLFREEYGVSPKKYIINLRIQNALGLISAGYYSLKEIADMSGYSDYKHFSTEFKKLVGVSPSEYLYNYSS